MEQIGLLGGAFDPIHWGHIQLCKEAFQKRNLDKIEFLPSYEHPFKGNKYLLTYQERCQLIELAIKESLPQLKASCNTIESEIEGTNYTFKTIATLKKQNPQAQYTFFIGTDNLEQLHLWKNILELPSICTLVCFSRKGFSTSSIIAKIAQNFPRDFYEKLVSQIIQVELPEISSTEIKIAINKNQMTNNMLPTSCLNYIKRLHHLTSKSTE